MFDNEILQQVIYMLPEFIAEAVVSCLYCEKFFSAKTETFVRRCVWITPYTICDILLFAILPNTIVWHDAIWSIYRIVILTLLQSSLFVRREIGMHAFTITSILSVVYFIRYLTSIPMVIVSDLVWSKIMPYLLNHNLLELWLNKPNAGQNIALVINTFLFLSTGCFGAFCIFYVLKKFEAAYTYKSDYLEKSDAVFLCIPCVTSIAISIATRIAILFGFEENTNLVYNAHPSMRFWIVAICALLLFTIYITIVLFQQMLARRDDVKIAAMQEAHISQLSAEINDLNEIYSDLRALRHDMNNHIENLSALFMSGSNTADIELYLDRMRNTADKLALSYTTGNPVCDIILHRKKTFAEENRISFECDFSFPDGSVLDAYDAGVILDNALDNALTASSNTTLSPDQRKIDIRSYQKGHLFFIEVKNSFIGDISIDPETYLPRTSKKDQANHGLGLSAIRRIADKYHGSAQAEIIGADDCKIFCLTVMMRLA